MSRSLYGHLARRFRPRESAERGAEQAERSVREADEFYPLTLHGHSAQDVPDRRRVGIIGAGFAGLTAAWWLSQHRFEVTVFEASDHPGGRVRSVNHRSNQRVSEHGAELIGRNHPNWLRLARRFNLPLSLITDDEHYAVMKLRAPLLIEGQTQDAKDVYDALDEALKKLNADARQVDPFRPWDAPLNTQWDNQPVSQWIASLRLPAVHEKALRFQLENMQTVSVEEQSYLGLLAPVSRGLHHRTAVDDDVSSYWSASEVFRCAEGNQMLARALAGSLPPGTVHYSSPVDTISIARDEATIHVRGGEARAYNWIVLSTPPACWPACEAINPD
jgi:monoamine oxidase